MVPKFRRYDILPSRNQKFTKIKTINFHEGKFERFDLGKIFFEENYECEVMAPTESNRPTFKRQIFMKYR